MWQSVREVFLVAYADRRCGDAALFFFRFIAIFAIQHDKPHAEKKKKLRNPLKYAKENVGLRAESFPCCAYFQLGEVRNIMDTLAG